MCMKGLKAVTFFSNADIIHVESSIQETELKPPLYKVTAIDINLEHSNKPDNLHLGIMKPVLSGVMQDLAAKIQDSNSCNFGSKSLSSRSPSGSMS